VAGMSDASIVIETDIKGGSMITADLANGYNREVFAYPGRINDTKSAGCNELIRTNRAQLVTDTKQILQAMGWLINPSAKKTVQKQLFIELSPEENCLVDLLKENEPVHIDELNGRSGLNHGQFANAIINLELANVIVSLPGKMYRLS
jgi:DNA processing protein